MKSMQPKTPKKAKVNCKASVKDPIEVFCRIRPLDNELDQLCIKAKDDKTVLLFPPDILQNTKQIKQVHYTFQHVFDSSTTQKIIFDDVCLPLIQNLLQGINGLLFTYGVTSSGKTYTMTGSTQDGGLLPRSLDVIFNSIKDSQAEKFVFKPDKINGFDVQSASEAVEDQQKELGSLSRRNLRNRIRKDAAGDSSRIPDTTCVENMTPDMRFAVFVTYVEIYNKYIYDLLDDSPIDMKRAKGLNSKILREDSSHSMYVIGVTETEVKTVDEALELLNKGQLRRRVSHTALNTESSRSHSVFTIRVVQAPLDALGAHVLQDKDTITVSQLSLVDLAGSERPVRTKNTGQKLREAGNINNSLMALKTCIETLREVQTEGVSKIVPYRESKLTHLFKSFFEGEGKIRMIVCANPHADYYNETMYVMQFAEMTQEVLIARPTPVSTPVLSLKSGRGNIFRAATKKAKEQGVPLTEVLPPTVYSLGSEFPQFVIKSPSQESLYTNMIQFLNTRRARRSTYVEDLSRRQEDFRKNLIAVDKDFYTLQKENVCLLRNFEGRETQVKSLEHRLTSKETETDVFQRQLRSLEKENDNLMKKLEEREQQVRNFEKEIAYSERHMNKKNQQIECIQNEYQMGIGQNERQIQDLERRLSSKEEEIVTLKKDVEAYKALCDTAVEEASELGKKLNAALEELLQLREKMLSTEDCDNFNDSSMSTPSHSSTYESSVTQTRSCGSRSSLGETIPKIRFRRIRSAIDFIRGNNPRSAQSPVPSIRNSVDSAISTENRSPNFLHAKRNIAVANPRHRRSASVGGVWIEHKPVGNLDLNTVLQLTVKKKKSVHKLKMKDVTKAQVSNYVLEHQEQDSQGEIETQLFKADIIPSAGGGAQVIFNDVEKLCQVSPPSVYNLRKRCSENLPLTEIEDRCAVSIGCHGIPSKIMRK